ncbi:hypothetical protein [Flagellimonas sp.]|uniref:hypothetical protein n=1 Tax=Flagellimonas sp. TaxID=2058762 RepID=UPI003F4A38A6
MRKGKFLIILIVVLSIGFLVSCSSGGDEGSTPVDPPPVNQVNPPGKAVGVLPENGEPCSEYEEVTEDDTKVQVAFQWNAANLAQSYTLIVNQGASEVFRNSLNALQTEVVLDRGQTYTWLVVAVNDDGQTNGDTFSFTTPGTPTSNFAPYAAEITADFDSGPSEMIITWIGNDEDGDELTFDVSVLEEGESIFESMNLTETTVEPILVEPNLEYVIEVISRDPTGNFSISRLTTSFPN